MDTAARHHQNGVHYEAIERSGDWNTALGQWQSDPASAGSNELSASSPKQQIKDFSHLSGKSVPSKVIPETKKGTSRTQFLSTLLQEHESAER